MRNPARSTTATKTRVLGATALATLAALIQSVPAQNIPEDRLVVFADGFLRYVDRFGLTTTTFREPSQTSAPFRAIDGRVWYLGTSGITVRNPNLTSAGTFPQQAVDLATDADGDAWIATSTGVLELRAPRIILTRHPLANGASHVAVDARGDVWAVQGRQLVNLTTSMAQPLPIDLGAIQDLTAGWNPTTRSPVLWVIGTMPTLVYSIDPVTGLPSRRYELPAATPRLRAVVPDAFGDVYVRTTGELWRLDTATGAARALVVGNVESFALDARGGAWVGTDQSLLRVEPDGRVDLELPLIFRNPGVLMRNGGAYDLANAVAPEVDTDGDGVDNHTELRRGTNPFDAQSSVFRDLTTDRVRYSNGSTVRLAVDGIGGPAILLASAGRNPSPQPPVPGLGDDLRLDPATLVAASVAVAVPGTIDIPIPDDPSLSGLVWFQALFANPLGLTNEVSVRYSQPRPNRIAERFVSSVFLDARTSSGTWQNGAATPGPLGGTGIHGSFDATLGVQIAPNVFEWSTDDMTIPASHTLLGNTLRVTDGAFSFTDFFVPAGTTVVFRGRNPAVIRVRGAAQIAGSVTANGETVSGTYVALPTTSPTPPFPQVRNEGQIGGRGGAGGAAGGRGAESCEGVGTAPEFRGRRGSDVVIPGSSGYGGLTASTGGIGGPLFPADGLVASVQFNLFNNFCGQLAGGGAGGAFLGASGDGVAVRTFSGVPSDLGPGTTGWPQIAFVPQPTGRTLLEHFAVGGAGGGGGGSQPLNMQRARVLAGTFWNAGGGGNGGGGVLSLRVGGDLSLSSGASLECRGGDGPTYTRSSEGPPSPGGGGSGGSLLVQYGGALSQNGVLDVSGGRGSVLAHLGPNAQPVESRGGDGGHGFVRVEGAGLTAPAALGVVRGPTAVTGDNFGPLTERDTRTGFQSLFYPLTSTGTPHARFYTLDVVLGSGPVITFSDDPNAFQPANLPGLPVHLLLQGRNPLTNELTPWVDFASELNGTGSREVRFMVLVDRTLSTDVRVTSFTLDWDA